MNLLEFCLFSDADTKRINAEEIIEDLQQENKQLNFLIENVRKHTSIDNGWECKIYKGHHCRYSLQDSYCDCCIFCGEPSERK